MSKDRNRKGGSKRASAATLLKAVPYRNDAMQTSRRSEGRLLVTVPMRRPRPLVPPLSWIVPFSSHRRVELDSLGASVLELCDGRRTVESVIERFAADHKLSFREAQLCVMQFLTELSQRGIVALVGLDKDGNEK